MDISKLPIDNQVLSNALAVGVRPIYDYTDGHRTSDEVKGFRYECVFPQLGYEKMNVSVVVGAKPLDIKNEQAVEVSFVGLNVELYWTPNGYQARATADSVHLNKEVKS